MPSRQRSSSNKAFNIRPQNKPNKQERERILVIGEQRLESNVRENKMNRIKVVDITGKKSFNCIKCGYQIPAPKRIVNQETLHHMQEAEALATDLERNTSMPSLANAILCICPKCGQPHLLADQFTKKTSKTKSS